MEETFPSKRTVLIDTLRGFRPEIQAIDLESMSISDLQHLMDFYELEVPQAIARSHKKEQRRFGDIDSTVIDEKSDTESRIFKPSKQQLAIGVSHHDDNFYVEFFNGNEVLIGRGGRGMAFINPEFPGVVIKKATSVDVCRGNNEEYDTIVTIVSFLLAFDFGALSMIKVYNYTVDDFLQCYLTMEYVEPPPTTLMKQQQQPTHPSMSIQFYMGEESHQATRIGRGRYIGRKEFFDMFGTLYQITSLEPWCYELGRFISTIHLFAEYDGIDMEYVLGHFKHPDNNGRPRLRLVALDFDLCKKVTAWDDLGTEGGISQCAWSLMAEPYYPFYVPANPNEVHYAAFKRGYLQMAQHFNRFDLGTRILKKVEQNSS